MKKIFVLLLFFLQVGIGKNSFDGFIQMNFLSKEFDGKVMIYVASKKNAIRVDVLQKQANTPKYEVVKSVLFISDSSVVQLDYHSNTYQEIAIKNLNALQETMSQDVAYEVELLATDKISSYKSNHFYLKMQDEKMEVWTTNDLLTDILLQKFLTISSLVGINSKMIHAMQEKKVDGFPIKMKMDSHQIAIELQRVQATVLPQSLFVIPKDFTKAR